MESRSRIKGSCASRIQRPLTGVAGHARRRGAARDRRGRRPGRAPLFGILRRHHPQQEHAARPITTPPCGSSPGSTGTRSARSPTSSRCMSPPISRRSARILRSRRSSSTSPPSACCSTGWSPARSSPPIRPMRSAGRSMSSRPARPRCSPANRPASSWTASTRQPWSACAIGR